MFYAVGQEGGSPSGHSPCLGDDEFEFCDNLPGLMMSRLQDAVEFCCAQGQG